MDTATSEQLVDGLKDAAERVALAWRLSGEKLLRLEGFMDVGKSRIASLLAQGPSIRVIVPDAFAAPGSASNDFEGRINKALLWAEADKALTESDRTIFEGVCLEELLPSSRFGAGFHVYIKRVSLPAPDCPLWHDGLDLDATEPGANWLFEDIRRYHRVWRPHERANLCLAVPEGRE
jgi:hypothetical protein